MASQDASLPVGPYLASFLRQHPQMRWVYALRAGGLTLPSEAVAACDTAQDDPTSTGADYPMRAHHSQKFK